MLNHDDIITAIVASTQDVFSTMLGMQLEQGKTRVETSSNEPIDGVVALVGMAGKWAGTGTISCSSAFACTICAQLLMSEATSVDEEVLDAVGEVANMILGNFKTAIEEKLGPLGLSIPTVVFGHNYTTRSLANSEWVVVPFHAGGERMDVKVCLAPSQDSTSLRQASHVLGA
jgi:chemotaxis protein CheX